MNSDQIVFTKPYFTAKELEYAQQVIRSGQICGDRAFTKKCQEFMEDRFGAKKVLLTHSCTAALEMSALLCGIEPGDEVIMPSFTFVSTANAFLLRGAKVKFVDIRADTFNIDEQLIEQAITDKTKAIVPVHYASIGCEMDKIMAIAEQYGLYVIEDAAQAVDTQYKGQYMGTIGDIGTYSFHETKNFVCGEGGAIVLNDDKWIEQAEIIREKGTNRSQFFRGQVDKYTWVGKGSSYVPSDILAAILFAQFEDMDIINLKRQKVADLYRKHLTILEKQGIAQLPIIPAHCTTNNHMFSMLFTQTAHRNLVLDKLKALRIHATFHYIPLHNSPYARQRGFSENPLPVTAQVSDSLLRLPMYPELSKEQVNYICDVVISLCGDF